MLPGYIAGSAELGVTAARVGLLAVEAVGEVVGCTCLVISEAHGSVSQVVDGRHSERAVHWQLQVVCSESVAVSVRVRE